MEKTPSVAFAVTLASISLIGPMAIHLFLPVIPAIKAAFGISDAIAQFTFVLGLFGMAASTLIYGALADRYGRRPVLLSGLCLFLLGSLISAAADSLAVLMVGRLVQAIGAGCGTTLVRAIARDAYGQANLVRVIAYLTMAYTLGPMIAPLAGGFLIDAFGWRTVFLLAFAIGAVVSIAVFLLIYETLPAPTTAASQSVVRDFADLFSHLRFNAFVLQTGFHTGVFFALTSANAVLMAEVLMRPAAEFGVYFLLFPIGFFTGNLVATRLSRYVSIEMMVLTGSLLLCVAVVLQSSLLLAGLLTPLVLFAPGFLITFAQGISISSCQAGIMATIPRLAGTAAGIGVSAQVLFGAIVAQIYGLVADGTILPLVATTTTCAVLALVAGATPAFFRTPAAGKAAIPPAKAID